MLSDYDLVVIFVLYSVLLVIDAVNVKIFSVSKFMVGGHFCGCNLGRILRVFGSFAD